MVLHEGRPPDSIIERPATAEQVRESWHGLTDAPQRPGQVGNLDLFLDPSVEAAIIGPVPGAVAAPGWGGSSGRHPWRSNMKTKNLLCSILCICVVGLVAPTTSAQAPVSSAAAQASRALIDTTVVASMKAFDVPGMAVAVVKDGRVVSAKGYGVKTLGQPAPVDDQTLFGIASNTKVFTAAALGTLVDEGKLTWNARVIHVLPTFRLSDPYVTQEMTIRDLLVHRSGLGLGAGDLLWWPASTYNRKEIVARLANIPLATSFRSAYAYDNVLYLVAGEVIEALTGQPWEDYVLNRLVKRVGMSTTAVKHSAAGAGGNVATPHAFVDGRLQPVTPMDSDNTNPAGGIMTGAADVAKWMIVFLNKGTLADGTRLYSDAVARELETFVTPEPIGTPQPELMALKANFRGYALGLEVSDYRGKKLVTHTGGLPGYTSRIAWLPELNVGVAVLTSQESGPSWNSIVYTVLDHYIGAADTNWVAAYVKVKARNDANLAKTDAATASARNAASKPSLPLERYAATYTDRWYGDIAITHDQGTLVMRFSKTPSLVGDLEHWQYDTFLVKWRDRELRADAFVTFSLTPEGTVELAKMKAASPSVDFSFDFQDLLLRPKR
jgi:CubicO group peptidase (beta-lactamase class C family)